MRSLTGGAVAVAPGPTLAAVRRMAHREAAAHLRHPPRAAWVDAPPVTVCLRVLPCPQCGVPRRQPPAALAPLAEVRVLGAGEPSTQDAVTLSALSCESPTGRSLLPLAGGTATGRPSGRTFVTRSAAWARLVAGGATPSLVDLVAALDAAESWVDGLPDPVLPAATRLAVDPRRDPRRDPRQAYAPHFITPHLSGPAADQLNRSYLRWRLAAVSRQLAAPAG
jgi:hypothetical protein